MTHPTPYEIIVVLMSDIVLRMEINPRMTMGQHAKFWLAELDRAGYMIVRKPESTPDFTFKRKQP